MSYSEGLIFFVHYYHLSQENSSSLHLNCGNPITFRMKSFSFALIFVFSAGICFAQGDSLPVSGSGPVVSGTGVEVNHAAAWEAFNRGETKKASNKLNEAIAEFDNSMVINPDFYQAAIARGGAKFLKYDFQGALSDYDIAIQIIEKLTQTYSTRSEIKNVLGDTQGSVEELDALNKLKPFLAEAYYRRGSVKKFLSNKEGSCSDFNKAMEMGYPKAEMSMKQYCGYVSPDSPAGKKAGGGAKAGLPKSALNKTDTLSNTPASNTPVSNTPVPEEKK